MMTGWTPTVEERADCVSVNAADALHDLLNADAPRPAAGDALPLLWHWLAFLPQSRQDQLGADGHPTPGDFLPPVGQRVRMYAGGRVTRSGTPRIGYSLARASKVSSVVTKNGRSGELLFVTVNHDISSETGSISEQVDLVYKQTAPQRIESQAPLTVDSSEWLWGRNLAVDPTVLFRFSALTYNAHRIHYDRPYATDIEGYPGLVVHGPLQAILLSDTIRRAFPGRSAAQFAFRAVAPAFDNGELSLRARPGLNVDSIDLAAFSDGRLTMTAAATLESEGTNE